MYRLLFSALNVLALSTTLFSQSVNGVPISEITSEYIQIVGTSKVLSNKVTIEIDFGQLNRILNYEDSQIVDEKGKMLVLNSMIDALNFMSKNGYEYVDAYALTLGSQNVYHYLMKRRSGIEENNKE